MKICFVRTADESMASARFRVFIPAKALQERGHTIKIINAFEECDHMIFSKHFNKNEDYKLFIDAKTRGTNTVYDVCDNHFSTPVHSAYYLGMTRAADIVTCNTPTMQEVIREATGKEARIVDDSYDTDMPFQEPKFGANEDPIRILWYGHFTNLNTLNGLILQMSQLNEEIHIAAVSNGPHTPSLVYENVQVNYLPWSMPIMKQHLDWCNFISIPTILNEPTKLTKSHNRVTDGIRAGRFVIAHPLPSYEIYRDKYAWIGEDLSDGILWADDNPEEALSRIKEGQEYIQANLSPDKIAQQWEDALNGST